MTESLTVYGFGSFFIDNAQPNDIDLLLLHRSADIASCQFAIACKAQIKSALPFADIVMLSQAEAESFKFVDRTGAVRLATLSSDRLNAQVQVLARRLSGIRHLR